MRMEEKFFVSVIIPVYNAELYLENAVKSAINLPEVGEIILIEDNSPDNALMICEMLVQKYPKISLYQHLDGINKGAAASRNLGIKKAKFPYIAFLDADDWYLPWRFTKEHQIFKRFPFADAVYSSVTLEENQHDNSKLEGLNFDLRQKIGYNTAPREFYKQLIKSKRVLFHTNGVTIKTEFLLKDKLFDERLTLHQDTELWNRLIRRGYFFASEINRAVAIIRRHEGNRITFRNHESQKKMLFAFVENVGINKLFDFEKNYLFETILRNKSKKIKSTVGRRCFFYFNYWVYRFRITSYLESFKKEHHG